MSGYHHIPTTWDDTRDERFFRITVPLFAPDFVEGAAALLASYDDDWCPDCGRSMQNSLPSGSRSTCHPSPTYTSSAGTAPRRSAS